MRTLCGLITFKVKQKEVMMKHAFLISMLSVFLVGCTTMDQRNEVYSDEIESLVETALKADQKNLRTVLYNSYIDCDKFNNKCTAYSYHRSFIDKSPVFFMDWSTVKPEIANVEFGYRIRYVASDWLFIDSLGFGSSDGLRLNDKVACNRDVSGGNIIESCLSLLSKPDLQKFIPIITSKSEKMVRITGQKYYDLNDDELEKFKLNTQWLTFMMSTAGNVILSRTQAAKAT